MKKAYLQCGKVCSAHGVRGLFNVEVWCDSAKVLAAQKRVFLAAKDGTYKECKVTSATPCGNTVILGLDIVTTREEAMAFSGKILYLKREDIPCAPGAYFLADLEGTPVIDQNTGHVYGVVDYVMDTMPGSRMFHVKTPTEYVLLPDVPAFIHHVDPETGVFVTPIEGLFPEEKA